MIMEALHWIEAHWDDIVEIGAWAFALITLIVSLTPSTEDDRWWRLAMERLSVLKPSNAPGQPFTLPGARPRRREATNAALKADKKDPE